MNQRNLSKDACIWMQTLAPYLTAKKLLDDRYGDPYIDSNAYLKKILEWPSKKTGDDAAVDRLATFLEQCLSAMTLLSYLNILDHPHNLQMLIVKLPFYLQDKWRREAIRIRGNGARIPSLKVFTKFVQCLFNCSRLRMIVSFLVAFSEEYKCQTRTQKCPAMVPTTLCISRTVVQRR
ncbi:Hypothetical predicted protein [Paramuricea clavata]|uniref:Uncharacterized protein n=1 Tax=Paramuricea clavata TaxID=317549 RepID=A0A6S7GFG1_PARCT|nr:Hypothetical predicted protein [Paramuricea clavata]